MKEYIILDLFSGIGGFSKGLVEAGFNIKKHFFSEIDPHAIAVYSNNFKNSEYVGSVTNVRRIIRRINEARSEGNKLIITFGSPCQDFSLAGKRLGMEGQRSSLIRYSLFLVKWLKPDFYIWENVKGAYSSNDGADYWAIIQAFANLDGYRSEQQLFNTSWFLPQNRERIYLVGYTTEGCRGGIFPVGENNFRVIKGTAETTVVNCLTAGGNSGGMHSSMTLINCLNPSAAQDNRIYTSEGTGPSLQSNNGCNVPFIQVKSATTQGFEEAGPGDSINFSVPHSETRRGRVGKGVAQTLDTACNQGVLVKELEDKFRFHKNDQRKSGIQGRDIFKEDCKTMDIIDNHPKNIIQGSSIRRLTEIECERLQGFPDNWTEYGNYNGSVKKVSKTQRYKMCGNAVSVPVVKAIGLKILEVNNPQTSRAKQSFQCGVGRVIC